MCKRGVKRKRRRLVAAAAQEASGMEFRAKYHVIERAEKFKYLLQIIFSD